MSKTSGVSLVAAGGRTQNLGYVAPGHSEANPVVVAAFELGVVLARSQESEEQDEDSSRNGHHGVTGSAG